MGYGDPRGQDQAGVIGRGAEIFRNFRNASAGASVTGVEPDSVSALAFPLMAAPLGLDPGGLAVRATASPLFDPGPSSMRVAGPGRS